MDVAFCLPASRVFTSEHISCCSIEMAKLRFQPRSGRQTPVGQLLFFAVFLFLTQSDGLKTSRFHFFFADLFLPSSLKALEREKTREFSRKLVAKIGVFVTDGGFEGNFVFFPPCRCHVMPMRRCYFCRRSMCAGFSDDSGGGKSEKRNEKCGLCTRKIEQTHTL